MEELRLTDFSGGVRGQVATTEALETQALELTGLVLDDERRLRSQWSATPQTMAHNPPRMLSIHTMVAGMVNDDVVVAPIDEAGVPGAWATLKAPHAGLSRPVGGVPVVRSNGESEALGILFVSPNSSSEPFAVYDDDGAGTWTIKTWTDNYPSGSPSTDAMPVGAGAAAIWADYLVLGDVLWAADAGQPFAFENRRRYVNGLWYSQPGRFDSWDQQDLEFMGERSSIARENQVVGLFPVDAGLLVLTTTRVILLRGTPSQHRYEELRRGVAPRSFDNVCWWAATGTVCWIDATGAVWQTNGEQFARLDTAIAVESGLAGADKTEVSIAAVGDYLFVSSPTACWVLSSYGEEGAWTRLAYPDPAAPASRFRALCATPGALLAQYDSGWVSMTVSSGAERGKMGATDLTSVLTTVALPGQGHDRTFWHRVGFRGRGSGRLLSARSFPAPEPAGTSLEGLGAPATLSDRADLVVPAHGPSLDATFRFELEGDVTVEGVTLWYLPGVARR